MGVAFVKSVDSHARLWPFHVCWIREDGTRREKDRYPTEPASIDTKLDLDFLLTGIFRVRKVKARLYTTPILQNFDLIQLDRLYLPGRLLYYVAVGKDSDFSKSCKNEELERPFLAQTVHNSKLGTNQEEAGQKCDVDYAFVRYDTVDLVQTN